MLDGLFRDADLDFFILFSITPSLGEAGRANIVLQLFHGRLNYRNRQRPNFMSALNWGSGARSNTARWEETKAKKKIRRRSRSA